MNIPQYTNIHTCTHIGSYTFKVLVKINYDPQQDQKVLGNLKIQILSVVMSLPLVYINTELLLSMIDTIIYSY